MNLRQSLLFTALWPVALGPPTTGVSSISYAGTYTATTPVKIWRGVPAELTVRGPSVGTALSVAVLAANGTPVPGMSASIGAASLSTDVLRISLSSQTSAPLGTFGVRIDYDKRGSNPDAFLVRLYDHGTVSTITMDGGVSGDIKLGQAYTFTATGSNLQNAEVSSGLFGAGVKDARVLSRSSTSVRVSFVPLLAETSIRLAPGIFFDRDMSAPTRTGPWSYDGAGVATVRTTPLAPVALSISSPTVLEGEQVNVVVKMNGAASSTTKAVVSLRSSSVGVTVPGTALVTGDNATFVAIAAPNAGLQKVTITAERAGVTVSETLSVLPLVVTLQSLKFVDATLDASPNLQITSLPNEGKQMVVRLNAPVAVAGGATVQITANAPGVVTIPATLTIPAGQSSGTFTVLGEATDLDRVVFVTATLGKQTFSRSVTVLRTTIKSIEPQQGTAPISVFSGHSAGSIVTLTGRAASTKTVQLTSSRPDLLTTNASVNIAAGQSRATTTIRAKAVATDQPASIAGVLDGISVTGSVSVMRLPIATSLTAGWNALGRFVLTATVDRDGPLYFSMLFTNDSPTRIEMDEIVDVGVQSPARQAVSYAKVKTSTGSVRPSYVAANIVEYPVTSPTDTLPASVTIRARAKDTLVAPHPGVSIVLQLRPYILTLNHTIGGVATAPTMTVSVNHSAGATIALSTSANAAGRVTIPATVSIPKGQRTATYQVTVASGATISGITFTARLGTLSKDVTVP
jgi:hypothetical protein